LDHSCARRVGNHFVTHTTLCSVTWYRARQRTEWPDLIGDIDWTTRTHVDVYRLYLSQLLIPALFTLYWPIHQASRHQIPVQLYPSHFLANTYFGTPWHRGNSLVILGRKALDGESNPDGVVHEVVLTSFLLHSPSSYHCSTPLPSLDIHSSFGSDRFHGISICSHGVVMSSSEFIQRVTWAV